MYRISLIFLFLALPVRFAIAEPLSIDEFRSLAVELSGKVNLFHDAWEKAPEAEFFGGTTRDYLYWLKGQLAKGVTPAELRARPSIDVREFIIGESDVDIVSKNRIALNADHSGLKKIDSIDGERFDPSTEKGRNELKQGYIPIEKIRLSKRGFVAWEGVGNGIAELYHGKPGVVFASDAEFASTQYAKDKLNHPVLLALRYLRLLAIDYYQRHGQSYPNQKALFDIDPAAEKKIRELIRHAADSGELAPYLEKPQFERWMNAAIQRAFRSYTNPTAAKLLFERFGVGSLVSRYPEKLKPFNQYVFSRYPEPKKYEANLAAFGVDPIKFYSPFPGGALYHGTKTPEDFRSIIFQGILPSSDGSAGAGLYGVRLENVSFAETWGGSPDRVVKLNVAPGAKYVDIRSGEGERVFKLFGKTEDEFAEAFGVDILGYPYGTEAFVVKNSAVLTGAEGHKIKLMTVPELALKAEAARTQEELREAMATILMNGISEREFRIILGSIEPKLVALTVNLKTPKEVLKFMEELGLGDRFIGALGPLKEALSQRLIGMLNDEGVEGLNAINLVAHRLGFPEALVEAALPRMKAAIGKARTHSKLTDVFLVLAVGGFQNGKKPLIAELAKRLDEVSAGLETEDEIMGHHRNVSTIAATLQNDKESLVVFLSQSAAKVKQLVARAQTPAELSRIVKRMIYGKHEGAYNELIYFERDRLHRFVEAAQTDEELAACFRTCGDLSNPKDSVVTLSEKALARMAAKTTLAELVAFHDLIVPFNDVSGLNIYAKLTEAVVDRIKKLAPELRTEADLMCLGETLRRWKVGPATFAHAMDQVEKKGGSPEVKAIASIAALLLHRNSGGPHELKHLPAALQLIDREWDRQPFANSTLQGHVATRFIEPRVHGNLEEFERIAPGLLRKYPEMMVGQVLGLYANHVAMVTGRKLNPPSQIYWGQIAEGGRELKRELYRPVAIADRARLLEGDLLPIQKALLYLERTFEAGAEIAPEDRAFIKKAVREFTSSQWIESHGKALLDKALCVSRAFDVLDELGLRQKLIALGDATSVGSLAWRLSRKPLRPLVAPFAGAAGKTAGQQGIVYVKFYAKDVTEYRSLTRPPDGRVNAFIDKVEGGGEGFATFTSDVEGAGFRVNIAVDPSAREGVDFEWIGRGGAVRWLTSDKLSVVSLTPEDMLELVRHSVKDNGESLSDKICLRALSRL